MASQQALYALRGRDYDPQGLLSTNGQGNARMPYELERHVDLQLLFMLLPFMARPA